jgi:hypothetical protein
VPSLQRELEAGSLLVALDIAGDLTAEAEVDAETLFARE